MIKTWNGVLIQAPGGGPAKPKPDKESHRVQHIRNKLSVLPPLKSLPPPVNLSAPISSSINLRVDFEREIQPYLGRCLVSSFFPNPCNSTLFFTVPE